MSCDIILILECESKNGMRIKECESDANSTQSPADKWPHTMSKLRFAPPSDGIQFQDRRRSVFASHLVPIESVMGRCVMNEKGRPGDFLSDGTFSREKMPRYLPRPKRRAHLVMLLLLSVLTDLGAQSSTPVPSISLPGSQSTFTGSEPEGKATPEVLQLGYEEAVER